MNEPQMNEPQMNEPQMNEPQMNEPQMNELRRNHERTTNELWTNQEGTKNEANHEQWTNQKWTIRMWYKYVFMFMERVPYIFFLFILLPLCEHIFLVLFPSLSNQNFLTNFIPTSSLPPLTVILFSCSIYCASIHYYYTVMTDTVPKLTSNIITKYLL